MQAIFTELRNKGDRIFILVSKYRVRNENETNSNQLDHLSFYPTIQSIKL